MLDKEKLNPPTITRIQSKLQSTLVACFVLKYCHRPWLRSVLAQGLVLQVPYEPSHSWDSILSVNPGRKNNPLLHTYFIITFSLSASSFEGKEQLCESQCAAVVNTPTVLAVLLFFLLIPTSCCY